ncbi:unnamed protein product [Alopecurus aequalis]
MADGAASLPSTPDLVDGLSALYDELLEEIITRLPVTKAASTAVLAKRWRYLWSSSPLVLDDDDLPEPARDALVPRILRDHRGSFRSVRLADCRLASLDRELPTWPRLLADKHTEELVLANTPNQPDAFPRLPADIFRYRSLQKLLLAFWDFPVDLSRGAGISLPHLRELDLVMIITSHQDLEDLISACPVLMALMLTTADENRPKHIRLRSRSLRVKIVCATNLRVLGDLDPRVHSLEIGDNAIELNTMASTSTVIPSVKILAVTVNFGVLWEVQMLASFLRCFPNIDTLHIKSALHDPSVTANEPSGDYHARFWKDVSPAECLRSHVKKMVIHKFQGVQNEFEFLKFVAISAQELQSLHVVLQQETVPSSDVVDEMEGKLQNLQFQTGISGVLRVLPNEAFSKFLQKATDLTLDDPFLL